ncbi:unnamed protein product [marine sediment metagenome]|uniref:Uncharacterized protein n=1 Tax=marine sediment metagenome TaxID=412755 RepID=X0V5T8_9ZZZZ
MYTQHADGFTPLGGHTEIASSGAWLEIFDTESLVDATGDFSKSYLLEGAQDFDRLDTEVVAVSGTTPVLTTAIAFAGSEKG